MTDFRGQLETLRELHHTDGAGEDAAFCVYDGYPTTLTCTCAHGHNRHSGKPGETRCMSYWNQPDCGCTVFVPAPEDLQTLLRSHRSLLEALVALDDLLDQREAANRYSKAVREPDDGHRECIFEDQIQDVLATALEVEHR